MKLAGPLSWLLLRGWLSWLLIGGALKLIKAAKDEAQAATEPATSEANLIPSAD